MKDNRLGGIALILSAIAGVIVMGIHPSGHHGIMSKAEMESLAFLTRAAHSLAIAGLPLSFLGCLALTRQLTTGARFSLVALVVYGFAAVAIMIAASMSGFVAPVVMEKLVAGDPTTDLRRLLLDYTFYLNQAFASVYVVGSCVAIILWSVAMLQTRILSLALGLYGVFLGSSILLFLFAGKLPLNVHGFGLVALTQSIWFIIAGILLLRTTEGAVPS